MSVGRSSLRYHDHRLPISPRTVDHLLGGAARRAGSAELAELADGLRRVCPIPADRPCAVDGAPTRAKAELADELGALVRTARSRSRARDRRRDRGAGQDPDRLDALLRRQNYRLAYWRTASEELDYRRFFNIETLVGVRVEDPEVFEETHALVLDLVRDGTVDGLRVDHVDGLRDPAGYLSAGARRPAASTPSSRRSSSPTRSCPSAWPVAGTSGYDFLTRVNDLFV